MSETQVAALVEVVRRHRPFAVEDATGSWLECICSDPDAIFETEPTRAWAEHLARALLAATAPTPDRIWLCSQCGEMPSVMVKIGTDDGWCVRCLDEAAVGEAPTPDEVGLVEEALAALTGPVERVLGPSEETA